ncbi:hypothetical protein AAX19_02275 [Oenococcus oeni]|nr:hypothetical protein AAX19_02275 [Oenococcus oeni]
MENKPNIAKNIREIRIKEDLTQEKLAELSGLSINFVSRLERSNNQNVSINKLEAIASALKVDIWRLLKSNISDKNKKEFPLHTKILFDKLAEFDPERSDRISKTILSLFEEFEAKQK